MAGISLRVKALQCALKTLSVPVFPLIIIATRHEFIGQPTPSLVV
jgi:hypothetical protein